MTPLLFGKLPAHGDFVARGMASSERDALDMWLSAEMAGARADAGAGFEDAFDAAPVWRFALPDGAAWRAGALAPSIDAAGRRFPLLFGWAGLPINAAGAAAGFADASLFGAISEGWDADRLASLDAPLAANPATPRPADPRKGWWTDTGDVAFTDSHPQGLLRVMLASAVAA